MRARPLANPVAYAFTTLLVAQVASNTVADAVMVEQRIDQRGTLEGLLITHAEAMVGGRVILECWQNRPVQSAWNTQGSAAVDNVVP
jgi:hypothetical protein